ncbi:hypothetical protein Bca4012_012657 [Brassica carinata]
MDLVRCCDCGCDCSASPWIRSVKRKHDELENEKNRFHIPELDHLDSSSSSNAKVQIENECELLRETLTSQQESIQELYAELDEERNAASTAANEAMSMILKLQRDKAEVQMELRQFKRFAEEKMEHDQQELLALEDLVYKREQTIQALTCEAQAYKHRMMSYGVSESEFDGERNVSNTSLMENEFEYDLPAYDYPPLKCSLNENLDPLEADVDVEDVEKYALTDSSSPHGREDLKSLEQRISQMERIPSFTPAHGDGRTYLEKVVVGQSPRHLRGVSTGSSSRDQRPEFSVDSPRSNNGSSFKKMEGDLRAEGKGDLPETGDNDMDDRVYTIDSIHHSVSQSDASEQKFKEDTADDGYGENLNQPDLSDPGITKLYMRLQALEADRESMRQAIVSMRTEKAQMVLLKEIAQHLSKDIIPERRLPLQKASTVGAFSFISVLKWITSFLFWRKRARRSKYMNGMQGSNMGLQMLLEKTPRIRQWRCLSRTQV